MKSPQKHPCERNSTPHQLPPINKFLISTCAGGRVAVLRQPDVLLSQADALLLAALLVHAADHTPDLGAFKSMLTSVMQEHTQPAS